MKEELLKMTSNLVIGAHVLAWKGVNGIRGATVALSPFPTMAFKLASDSIPIVLLGLGPGVSPPHLLTLASVGCKKVEVRWI